MNVLAQVRFTLDIPEAEIAKIVGRPDDGSDEYQTEAYVAVEEQLKDSFHEYLDYMTAGEPDVTI